MVSKRRRQRLPHKVQKAQAWLVGQRVRVTKLREPCLRDVPDSRLTSCGVIERVTLRYPHTTELRRVVYTMALDSRILGSKVWVVTPGHDTIKVELI